MTLSHLYYFAYGSNMSVKRIQQRLPKAKLIGTARLPGYDLRFHKVGDDNSAKCDAYFTGDADEIHGVVYQLHSDEQAALDRIEGVGKGYDVRTVEILTNNQTTLSAFIYVATRINTQILPYNWYHYHVLQGATEHQIPQSYIDEKINAVQTKVDSDVQRAAREAGIYQLGIIH